MAPTLQPRHTESPGTIVLATATADEQVEQFQPALQVSHAVLVVFQYIPSEQVEHTVGAAAVHAVQLVIKVISPLVAVVPQGAQL